MTFLTLVYLISGLQGSPNPAPPAIRARSLGWPEPMPREAQRGSEPANAGPSLPEPAPSCEVLAAGGIPCLSLHFHLPDGLAGSLGLNGPGPGDDAVVRSMERGDGHDGNVTLALDLRRRLLRSRRSSESPP